MGTDNKELIHDLANNIVSIMGKARKVKKMVDPESDAAIELDKILEVCDNATISIKQMRGNIIIRERES